VTSKTLAHPAPQIKPPREPQFAEFYQPRKPQKPGELLLLAAARSLLASLLFTFFEFEAPRCYEIGKPSSRLERHRCHQKISGIRASP